MINLDLLKNKLSTMEIVWDKIECTERRNINSAIG